MSEERKTAEVEAVGDEDGRRQLWVRAGMAVGLIGLLLGGLAVFFILALLLIVALWKFIKRVFRRPPRPLAGA